MTKLDLLKGATNFIVSAGVSKIVVGIIKNNTDPEKITDVVSIYVGGTALGMMVAHHTKEFTSQAIDEAAEWWTKNITPRINK